MCDPQPASARITDGGPCARRVRYGEPLRVIGRVTSVEGGCPLFVMYNAGYYRVLPETWRKSRIRNENIEI